MKNRLFPVSFYNPVSFTGAVIASISFGLILFLILLEALSENPKPYMGILAFVILPGFLIFGLLLIAFGIFREKKKRAKADFVERELPRIDLNDPKHRFALTVFSVGTILLLLFTAFGSYKAYEYTDSDEFCGTLCHTVMEPEYTAYLTSPHSRVGCVKCHIGPGADWFVQAKISGAYQFYSVAFNLYPRPIPTPIENLRPAQQTCEQCHWPKHFFSEKKINYTYYLSDEENTKSSLTMLVLTGGGNPEFGISSGIHWHMNIDNTVSYYHLDKKRMEIPYVKSVSSDGVETVYRSTEFDFNEKNMKPEYMRRMDCIDCHNRPSHIYNQPDKMVNLYMSMGRIDETLPHIKSLSVEVLETPYSDRKAAKDSIGIAINNFYSANYPEIHKSKKIEIEKCIDEIRKIYSRNYFPEMKVNWRRFPNNNGHVYNLGCFRCHDGKHKSEDGKIISNDCNICHLIIEQEIPMGIKQVSLSGLEFIHPVDLGFSIKDQICTDCHESHK